MPKPSSPRRGPRAAIMVAAVAILAAGTIAVLGFNTTTPGVPGIPRGADLVTVTGTPVSQPVRPGFVGLSLEYTSILHYAGTDPSAINPVFVGLVRGLAPGGRPALRIGGDTTDWGWFRVPGMRQPGGIRFTLDQRWVQVVRALAQQTQAQLILGLNLEAASPKLMALQGRQFLGIGRGALAAYEMGNEPELFGHFGWYRRHGHPVHARPRRYNFPDYSREVSRYSRVLPAGVPLAGPATGAAKWWAATGAFVAAQPRVRVVTFHLYPLARCLVDPHGPYSPTIGHLLQPASSVGLAAEIAGDIAPIHRHGAQLRIDELNSVSCGGASGVSDRFASALWAIDTLFALAREGVDGVNFHTFAHAYYRPFAVSHHASGWVGAVAPMYYGLLAFTRAAPAGATLLRTGSPSVPGLRVWATRAPDRRVRVMLLNTSPTRDRTIAIKLPRPPGRGGVSLQRLSAPSLSAAHGISLAGQRFPARTSTGTLPGHPLLLRVQRVRPGIYLLRLPAGSAALLTD